VDRVFLPSSAREGELFVVKGAERRHLGALRLRAGERFLATDGEGREFVLETREVERARVVARVVEEQARPRGPGARVTLAVAPPKGTRMETAVEKATECGVGRIVPIETERSVVRGRGETERLARWRRVAASATAQSGSAWTPEVLPFTSFADALEPASGRLLLAHPSPEATSMADAIAGIADGTVTLLVGPEGGFTDAEIGAAKGRGAVTVCLGPNRLRTETAAIVGVALAIAALGGERRR
jgi:16S rRNA (uracil1498-N3)-methyltransferase